MIKPRRVNYGFKDCQCNSRGIELNELEELFEDVRCNNYYNSCDNYHKYDHCDHHNHCDHHHDNCNHHDHNQDAVTIEEIVVRDLNQNQFLRKELLKYNLY